MSKRFEISTHLDTILAEEVASGRVKSTTPVGTCRIYDRRTGQSEFETLFVHFDGPVARRSEDGKLRLNHR